MENRWEIKSLGKVCEILNGGTPDTKISKFWNDDHLWITPKDMGKLGSIYVDNTERKISDLGLKNSSAKLIPINSIILSTRAPIGYLAINTKEISTNQGCKGLVPKDKLLTAFLFYFLTNSVELLNKLGSGTTFKELSGSKLSEVQIPLPPIDEQKRIVGILDEVFEGVAKAKENVEGNLRNVSEVFEAYLQSVFTAPSKNWETCDLGNCVKFIDYRGRTPHKTAQGMRLITAKNVKNGFIQLTPEEFVNPDIYDSWMTRGIPKKGDILFTTEAPLANVAQLDTDEKVVFAQRIIILQPDSTKLDQTFLKYLLVSNPIRQEILSKGTGATVQGIKASLLKKIKIYFPKSLSEQKSIVTKLDALATETKKLEEIYKQKLTHLEELKKSILKKAFNGEL
jgi:type I restriction enzyme, S subunit